MMNHLIGTPETIADAVLLERALDRSSVQHELVRQYAPELVARTIHTAHGWVGAAFDGRPLGLYGTRPGMDMDAVLPFDDVEATAVFSVDALAEPPSRLLATAKELAKNETVPEATALFIGRKPEAFGPDESKVVLSALRHMTHVDDRPPTARREVAHYLSRNAPTATQRALSKVALHAMKGVQNLLEYKDARIARSRNSPHWFTGTPGGSRNQRRYPRHG